MSKKYRIGLGIITCNREDLFRKSVAALPKADTIVVVNDGRSYPASTYPSGIDKVIQHVWNKGVGRSKNEAIHYLMKQGCDHIFLSEDDISIVDASIFDRYITASTISGIQHFNFGYHGPKNKSADGTPAPRFKRQYQNGVELVFNQHLTGAFSYYSREILEKVGYMDPLFINAYDHVDHTYQIIKEDGHPPFGWFADIAGSDQSIIDLDQQLLHSVIRRNGLMQRIRLKLFSKYFRLKNGRYPWELITAEQDEVEQWIDSHGVGINKK